MRTRQWLFAAAALLAVTGAALAQGPGGPGGPGGGGFSPEMRQRMQEFRKFRDQHEQTFRLRGTLSAIGEMEKGKRAPLTPGQAKKILAIVTPLKSKPKLTQDQAKEADKKLRAVLTVKQLNEVSRIAKEMRERRRGGPGGGRPGGPGGPGGAPSAGRPGGGPGGPGGPGGARPQFDMKAMKDFNPFAPPKSDNPMAKRGYQHLQEGITALQKKATQRK